MNKKCDKCGYFSLKNREVFEKNLCEFCFYFAPKEKKSFLVYVDEMVNPREIQTYRKQGMIGGITKKREMKKKARDGMIMSRAPFGYEIKNKKLIPAQNSHLVREIYNIFLNNKISLNKLSKKYTFSINGLKKILTNFTYIGKIKFDEQIYDGNHESIISLTIFNQVQDKLNKLKIKI